MVYVCALCSSSLGNYISYAQRQLPFDNKPTGAGAEKKGWKLSILILASTFCEYKMEFLLYEYMHINTRLEYFKYLAQEYGVSGWTGEGSWLGTSEVTVFSDTG